MNRSLEAPLMELSCFSNPKVRSANFVLFGMYFATIGWEKEKNN